jgi:hypothetical protein
MNAYVEECRREWKRLGVPPGLAEEMAAELEADLAEAEADGVSAAEMLGESDPRRFAATWARERGLVADPPPKKSRKRFWIVAAVSVFLLLVFFVVALTGLALATGGGGSNSAVRVGTPVRIKSATVPNLIGLGVCKAIRVADRANIAVSAPQGFPCDAVVVRQRPAPRAVVPANAKNAVVTVKLRRPGG